MRFIEIIEEWIYWILSVIFAGAGTAIDRAQFNANLSGADPDWFINCSPYFQIFAWSSAGVLAIVGIIVKINLILDRRKKIKKEREQQK